MYNKLIFMLIAITLTGCATKQVQQPGTEVLPVTQITGLGKIIPEGGISELASPVSGIVTAISVAEGAEVKKGDLLVQLDNSDQTLAVGETGNKITTQQRAVESQKWLIGQKKSALDEMLRKLTDAQDLLKRGATTGENVRVLQNDYEQASREMKKLESDLAVQQSQLNEVRAQQEIKMNQFRQTSLRAPVDGTVLDILPKPGESVSQFQTYARLAPGTPLVVQAEIDEMFAPKLATGQVCTLRLPGENEPFATGKIVRISADLKKKSLFSDSGDDLEDRRVREAVISIDAPTPGVLINTKVECTIQVN